MDRTPMPAGLGSEEIVIPKLLNTDNNDFRLSLICIRLEFHKGHKNGKIP